MGERGFGRRAVLGALLAGWAALAAGAAGAGAPATADWPAPRPGGASGPPAGAERLAAAAARDGLTGRIGFALVDVATGETVEARLGDEGFPPASVAKAVTAQFALERLGPEHRFETRLAATGPLVDGVVQGDLILIGGGDPELDTEQLAELAAQAHARGVTGATGRFLVDPGLPEAPLIDPEQREEAAYNPGVGGLNLNFNRVLLMWEPKGRDFAVSLEARAWGATAVPRSVEVALAEDGEAVFVRREDAGRELWEVDRRALRRKGQRWLPVRRPAVYAGDVFRTLAAERGLSLPELQLAPGRTPRDATVVARRFSRPLTGIMADMLDHSTNLTAEAAGLAASGERDMAASGAAMSAWASTRIGSRRAAVAAPARPALAAGIAARLLSAEASEAAPAGRIDLRNHSGLSALSRATPEAMAAFLRAAALEGGGAAEAGALGPLLEEVALDGRRGEADLPKGVACNAKTGTLNYVRGLAGYLTAASGRRFAFAIFSEDLARRAAMADGAPSGASRAWLGRARGLERDLLRHWAARL